MANNDPEEETYSEAEAEARREAALQVMFKTPHKKQGKLKRGDKRKKT